MDIDVNDEVKGECCPDPQGIKDAKKIMVKMRCPEGEDADKIKEKVRKEL